MKPSHCLPPLACALALVLCSCSGKVSFDVTDAPVDGASKVVIQFDSIELKGGSGTDKTLPIAAGARQIDLLTLQGSQVANLVSANDVREGSYNAIRLHITDNNCDSMPAGNNPPGSYIQLSDGSIVPLHIPEGGEAGLETSGFTLNKGDTAQFTIEFDLRKSISKPDGKACYYLKPHLRLLHNDAVGSIIGSVPAARLSDEACDPSQQHPAAIYLFSKPDSATAVTPDDIDGVAPEPVTSAGLVLNTATGNYDYEFGFILPGNYVASLTCDADLDAPEQADAEVGFLQSQQLTVTRGDATRVDFE